MAVPKPAFDQAYYANQRKLQESKDITEIIKQDNLDEFKAVQARKLAQGQSYWNFFVDDAKCLLPLHIVAAEESSLAILHWLLDNSRELLLDHKSIEGYTPLEYAIKSLNWKAVALLVMCGCGRSINPEVCPKWPSACNPEALLRILDYLPEIKLVLDPRWVKFLDDTSMISSESTFIQPSDGDLMADPIAKSGDLYYDPVHAEDSTSYDPMES
jgi:hypothetical protein